MERWARTAAFGLTGLALIAAPLSAPAGAEPRAAHEAAAGVDAPVPMLDWQPCTRVQYRVADPSPSAAASLQCTEAAVPLDYDDPLGATTTLFMAMRPANNPAQRLGTLFINPGGPGGPGSKFVDYFASRLGNRVRNRFDIVGIDPRGIGLSNRMHCWADRPIPPFPREYVPLTPTKATPVIRFYRYLAEACAATADPITDHMSTADVARDFDLIRQAVGDEAMTYYGLSYGSYLGATYASMFPDEVGALVVDAVLDPIAWSTGRGDSAERRPVSARTRSGIGAWESLVSAFAECDRVGRARCALAGQAANRWRDIVNRLKPGPARVDGGLFYYSTLVDAALGELYNPSRYRVLMREISLLHDELFAAKRPSSAPSASEWFERKAASGPPRFGPTVRRAGQQQLVFTLPFESVLCADSVNPRNPHAWIKAGSVADREGPWFGRYWTWLSNLCARYPLSTHSDAFDGPWATTTASPLLVIGNVHDPATPISGARVVNGLFEGSRLLTVDQWGHGGLGRSSCVTHWTASYLISGELPPPGAVCKGNGQLFPQR